jgi:type VI secretion system protein ImpF
MSATRRLKRSVFDRLLPDDDVGSEALLASCTLAQLREWVARDLEHLLNTRSAWLSADAPGTLGPYTRRSLWCFGVPDFADRVLASSEDQRHIAQQLACAITDHEPRLQRVHVEVHPRTALLQALQFTIHADLVARPLLEAVSFDAVLLPAASRYRVAPAPGLGT